MHGRVEGNESDSAHRWLWVLQREQELPYALPQQGVDRLRLIGYGEFDGRNHRGPHERVFTGERLLQVRKQHLRIDQDQLAETLGDHVARPLLRRLAVFEQLAPNGRHRRHELLEAVRSLRQRRYQFFQGVQE